jgi:hypothetical protein
MIRGCIIGIALLAIAIITLIVFLVSRYIQPILPPEVNSEVVLFLAIFTTVLGVIASFNGIIELLDKFLRNKPHIVKMLKAIKPKPRLTIAIRDVNCIPEKIPVSGPRYRGEAWAWWIECVVEIRNQRRLRGLWGIVATDVSGVMRLTIGQGDNPLKFETVPGTARRFSLTKGESCLVRVRFPQKMIIFPERVKIDAPAGHEVISPEQFQYYPTSPYLLEYIYSCSTKSHMKASIKGRFAKVDWKDPLTFSYLIDAEPFLRR